jgi:hypothetical protein
MMLNVNIDHGEDYGFPKILPQRLNNLYQNSREVKEWFEEQGYPKDLFEKNKWTITSRQISLPQ